MFAEWPTPLVAVGAEVGAALPYPGASIEKDFAWSPAHPVVDAYRAFKPMPYDAPASALAAVLYAAHPEDGLFTLSPPGTITVPDDGRTQFTPGPSRPASLPDRRSGEEGGNHEPLYGAGRGAAGSPARPPGWWRGARGRRRRGLISEGAHARETLHLRRRHGCQRPGAGRAREVRRADASHRTGAAGRRAHLGAERQAGRSPGARAGRRRPRAPRRRCQRAGRRAHSAADRGRVQRGDQEPVRGHLQRVPQPGGSQRRLRRRANTRRSNRWPPTAISGTAC